ncbi:hypothetical protein E3P92_03125 [Wallemia ichthyophaga]|uniref:Uncharacterized protein n=1 Tax=Wallemia ichthyophaga TaxID=245174 RepID=A0A4T0H6F8_WALIC|nr:hypothetical protein E3P91_02759 [Wallemia ichthyophaga]TIA97675.1 hypothetical protein E3P95_02750 [Wallemia ichthyophaga]TIA98789.1 hypothetical protein E3P94_02832 [Wallemia ichthyophaga]TIB10718.1 hypothetical protein E3P92_03125 [Wallemia ichthyophaga]TIB10938.1 hypothetical protein E3P90_02667 [Wallemia ichthyophaga]
MKKSKSLLKNLQKSDKEYENSLINCTQFGNISASALLALGSIDDSGSINFVGNIFQEINNCNSNYTNTLFKCRQSIDQLIDQENHYYQVDKDRQLLISQVIKASSKKSNQNNSTSPDKLNEAQNELRACQFHLTELELDLMASRQRIINSTIQLKLSALSELGENFTKLANQGLDHFNSVPTSANLLDNTSIDSLSPSQSASQINVESRRNSIVKSRYLSDSHQQKPSMFTEQFSVSSIQSPSPKPSPQPQRQPLFPPPPNQSKQSQQKPAGFLRRLFGVGSKKHSNHLNQVKQDKQDKAEKPDKAEKAEKLSKPSKKNLFNVAWGSKTSNLDPDSPPSQPKQSNGWQTRTTSNINSLERGDSSDDDDGSKFVTVTNKNPQAAIAENISRQSSATSANQTQRKIKPSSRRHSRSNSLGDSQRPSSLPERPSSAASLPLNAHGTKKTKKPSKYSTLTSSPQINSNSLTTKPTSKNLTSNGTNHRKPANSTTPRNRKVVVHPNLMSIVEGDNLDQDFNPSSHTNGTNGIKVTKKSKGKQPEHLPSSVHSSPISSLNNQSLAPIRKDSNRSSRSDHMLPKNVSWAQSPAPPHSISSQRSLKSNREENDDSSDDDNGAYNAARSQLTPLDFSTLK